MVLSMSSFGEHVQQRLRSTLPPIDSHLVDWNSHVSIQGCNATLFAATATRVADLTCPCVPEPPWQWPYAVL